jgi:hypothetical protein
MRDAILLQDLEFEYRGKPAVYAETWITESGEIYISLRIDEHKSWINISAKEIKNFVKDKNINLNKR